MKMSRRGVEKTDVSSLVSCTCAVYSQCSPARNHGSYATWTGGQLSFNLVSLFHLSFNFFLPCSVAQIRVVVVFS